MSADNGYILRKDSQGNFCLQMYFASNDEYPNVETTDARMRFPSLEEACVAYEHIERNDYYASEYGLTISVTTNPKKEDIPLVKLTNYTRRPFSVDSIQVTYDNLQDVANLCGGTLVGSSNYYIAVPVKRPSNPRQAQAYVGDWVVYYQRGWKVYQDKAFRTTFQDTVGVANDLEGFARREASHNVFDDHQTSVSQVDLDEVGVALKDAISGEGR